MRIGLALITEEHAPGPILAFTRAADQLGFDYLSVSDHFHPWLDEQGESPFAWSLLGALTQVTDRPLMTSVTCPIKRYHPAIVAQAAATVATMASGGFTLGLGTGENLNEHVVGGAWPGPPVRLAMLAEAVEVIRELWAGDVVSHHGPHVTVDRARLYTLPTEEPGLAIAAGADDAARIAAESAADLVVTSPDKDLIATYRDAGGTGQIYGQATICFAESEDAAARVMQERWRQSSMSWPATTEIPTPAGFAAATTAVDTDDVRGSEPLGPDIDAIVASLATYGDAGCDAVAIHPVGDPALFLDRGAADVLDGAR